MSTQTWISAQSDEIPQIVDHRVLLNQSTSISLPMDDIDRAEWCRDMAALLIEEAASAIASAESNVRDLRTAAADIPGTDAATSCLKTAERISNRVAIFNAEETR